jgi:Tfp pilus assembly protein FimT
LSLVDLLLAIALTGALLAGGATSLGRFTDRSRVEAVAGSLQNAYRRAQSVARAWGRPAEIVISPDSIVIRALSQSSPTVVWRETGPAALGVAVAPALHVLAFAPSGLAMGAANVSHVLTRGGARRQVIVSRLGRVRVTP